MGLVGKVKNLEANCRSWAKVGEFIQVGLGYNWTNFNDDLTRLDYTAQGPFIRLSAKFYDRTPEQIERARQRRLEAMIKQWAWELVNEELAKPNSTLMQELYHLYYLAKTAQKQKRLKTAQTYYERIGQTGRMLYIEAEEYIRSRIELEKRLKEKNVLALAYYKQGRLEEAKALWEKLLEEAKEKPLDVRW